MISDRLVLECQGLRRCYWPEETGKMEKPTIMRNGEKRTDLERKGGQKLTFVHAKLEIPVRHSSLDVQGEQLNKCIVQRKVQAGGII